MTAAEQWTLHARAPYRLLGPVLTFTVDGIPVSQGNIRHLGKGRPAVHQNAVALLPWRARVAAAAHNAIVAERRLRGAEFPVAGPVGAAFHFTLPKPASAPKRRRTFPAVRPDVSHLVRAVEDAISLGKQYAHGRVLHDDGQIVWELATKAFPGEEQQALDAPGVLVRIYQIGEADV